MCQNLCMNRCQIDGQNWLERDSICDPDPPKFALCFLNYASHRFYRRVIQQRLFIEGQSTLDALPKQ